MLGSRIKVFLGIKSFCSRIRVRAFQALSYTYTLVSCTGEFVTLSLLLQIDFGQLNRLYILISANYKIGEMFWQGIRFDCSYVSIRCIFYRPEYQSSCNTFRILPVTPPPLPEQYSIPKSNFHSLAPSLQSSFPLAT